MQAQALLHFVTVAERFIRLLRRKGALHGRDIRGGATEDVMQIWMITELMLMTRDELCDLMRDLEQLLAELEVGTVQRSNALASLENIRRAMNRKGFHP